jgi:hypothetical protein
MMKKLLVVGACVVGIAAAQAQGTVNFANLAGANIQPIMDVGGTATLDAGWAQLELADGTALGTPVAMIAGGLFFGPAIDTGVAAGTAVDLVVRAWDGGDGSAPAGNIGVSDVFSVTTGGVGDPPGPPADIVFAGGGMQSFALVPEPTTLALALLGGIALMFRRRK